MSSGPLALPAAALSSGRSSASTTPDSRVRRARERRLGADAGFRPHRRDHGDAVLHRVEHHDQRRADQDRVGNADRIGMAGGQLLHQPHHVVAEIAEHAGRHRRQAVGQRDAAFGDQRAQRLERRLAGRARSRRAWRCALRLISARAPFDAPDQVGLEADDRIAAAHRAAFDRLEQEAHRPRARDLQERRDRRLQVGDQRGPHHLRLAARVARGEALGRRLDLHGRFSSARRRVAWLSAFWLMVTPTSFCSRDQILRREVLAERDLQCLVDALGVGVVRIERRHLDLGDAEHHPLGRAGAFDAAGAVLRRLEDSATTDGDRPGAVPARLMPGRHSTFSLSAAMTSANAVPALSLSSISAALVFSRAATSSSRQRALDLVLDLVERAVARRRDRVDVVPDIAARSSAAAADRSRHRRRRRTPRSARRRSAAGRRTGLPLASLPVRSIASMVSGFSPNFSRGLGQRRAAGALVLDLVLDVGHLVLGALVLRCRA